MSQEVKPEKNYLIVPGPMKSKEDGESYIITADSLIHLYNVDPDDCHIYTEGKDLFRKFPPDILLLIPRYERQDYDVKKCFTVGKMIVAGFLKEEPTK